MAASIPTLARQLEPTLALINPEERARAARFINPDHGENFALVRGTLRRCLASYLGIDAGDIEFIFNQYGKPAVTPAQNKIELHFNVSHSHQMAAFGFTIGRRVGIDIEAIKSLKDMQGLTQHICSPEELAEFSALADHDRKDAFFRLWTRKEAFIKADGQGLSMGLRSIYLGLDESTEQRPVQYQGIWLKNWLVKDLPCVSDYKLAIASEILEF